MTGMDNIDQFLSQKTLAIVGVSQNPKKFGNLVYKNLKKKGYHLYPIHPTLKDFDGEPCYPSLTELPEKIEGVFIAVSPDKTKKVVKEAMSQGIENIWIQQHSETPEVVAFCQEHGLKAVYDECILMYANPVGFPHSMHKLIKRMTGKLPR